MNIIKLTFAAAILALSLSASASAMPIDRLSTIDAGGVQADQVRLVCNRWGRCWHVGGYRYHRYHWRHRYHHHRWHHRHHRRHWY